jgi:deoxyribodipyrimidine photo-lyase
VKLQIVWFKRDLRWEDHAPLAQAVATGQPVVGLVLYEPSMWAQPLYSRRHEVFVHESVTELQATAPCLGSHGRIPLWYVNAEAVEAFEALSHLAGLPIGTVFSHEEVGIEATFARDRRMKKWFAEREIQWVESPYGSVRRGLKRRTDWNVHWNEVMFKEPLT